LPIGLTQIGNDGFQNRLFEERYPNGRFPIRKRTLAKDTMNGRSWPISAVWQSERLRPGWVNRGRIAKP
jgi:hypothetical protein